MMSYRSLLKTIYPSWLVAVLLIGPSLPAAEKPGEGEGLLKPVHYGGDTDSLESAMRRSSTPEGLALAAASAWIRKQKAPAEADLSALISLATERELRDEVALMLAFPNGLGPDKFQSLIERLATDPDPEVRRLAAATLSTVHLHRFLSNPGLYASPHLDQQRIMERAREAEEAFPESPADMETCPDPRPWVRRLKKLPPLPLDWFTAKDRTLVSLAMTAAAFDGSPDYAEWMNRLDGGKGTPAGARLLYLCRQDTPPSKEDVIRMFTDAFRSEPGPVVIQRPGNKPSLVDPYEAEIPGGVLACMALGLLGDPETQALLVKALEIGDLPVKMEALRALRRMEADDSVQADFARLLPKAPGLLLPDLCAAISIHPDKRLIPLLLLRLKEETGRFRLDLAHALATLTGGVHGGSPEEWIDWWRENRETFEIDAEASAAFRLSRAPQTLPMPPTGRFYGLEIFSDHLVYVVDTSESMRGTRIQSLRENLINSLEGLSPPEGKAGDVHYNVVDFGGDVIQMEPGRLVTDRKDGIRRVEEMPMTWGTRSFDAIWSASRLPGVDTLYFLSDGAPVWGQVERWPQMRAALTVMYWHRPIAVWSVAFEAGKSNAMDMRRMSYGNFGLFEEL